MANCEICSVYIGYGVSTTRCINHKDTIPAKTTVAVHLKLPPAAPPKAARSQLKRRQDEKKDTLVERARYLKKYCGFCGDELDEYGCTDGCNETQFAFLHAANKQTNYSRVGRLWAKAKAWYKEHRNDDKVCLEACEVCSEFVTTQYPVNGPCFCSADCEETFEITASEVPESNGH